MLSSPTTLSQSQSPKFRRGAEAAREAHARSRSRKVLGLTTKQASQLEVMSEGGEIFDKGNTYLSERVVISVRSVIRNNKKFEERGLIKKVSSGHGKHQDNQTWQILPRSQRDNLVPTVKGQSTTDSGRSEIQTEVDTRLGEHPVTLGKPSQGDNEATKATREPEMCPKADKFGWCGPNCTHPWCRWFGQAQEKDAAEYRDYIFNVSRDDPDFSFVADATEALETLASRPDDRSAQKILDETEFDPEARAYRMKLLLDSMFRGGFPVELRCPQCRQAVDWDSRSWGRTWKDCDYPSDGHGMKVYFPISQAKPRACDSADLPLPDNDYCDEDGLCGRPHGDDENGYYHPSTRSDQPRTTGD